MKINFLKPIIYSLFSFSAMMIYSQTAPNPVKLYDVLPTVHNQIKSEETFNGHVVRHVTDPAIYIYSPEEVKNTGAAVIICPGGGYAMEAVIHEGFQVAEWLASEGVTGIVLKYRLPNGVKEVPLNDVERAFELVHQKADSLHINSDRIGIAGFSAGGHLAAIGGTKLKGEYRPDFMLLFYPVISLDKSLTHNGSRVNLLGKGYTDEDIVSFSANKQVNSETPPTLLLLSDDDKVVNPINSICFYEELKKNNVKSAMYIFPTGGHGWGYQQDFAYHETWKTLLIDWLKSIGVISR